MAFQYIYVNAFYTKFPKTVDFAKICNYTKWKKEKSFMKSTGIVRRVDELGRIVMPVELRRSLNIEIKDPMEIYVDENMICLKKYEIKCMFCESQLDLIDFNDAKICSVCLEKIKNLNIWATFFFFYICMLITLLLVFFHNYSPQRPSGRYFSAINFTVRNIFVISDSRKFLDTAKKKG